VPELARVGRGGGLLTRASAGDSALAEAEDGNPAELLLELLRAIDPLNVATDALAFACVANASTASAAATCSSSTRWVGRIPARRRLQPTRRRLSRRRHVFAPVPLPDVGRIP
jgi:hypothetical protein